MEQLDGQSISRSEPSTVREYFQLIDHYIGKNCFRFNPLLMVKKKKIKHFLKVYFIKSNVI
jgi:hypothetical protein